MKIEIIEKYSKRKEQILLETEKKVKYMLDNWTKTFIVYPILYKEQTNDLGRRSYIFTQHLECPTLKRYHNFKQREVKQDITFRRNIKLMHLIEEEMTH